MSVFSGEGGYTLRIAAFVPVGDRIWVPCRGGDPAGWEYAYGPGETAKALRVWGVFTARVLGSQVDRFALVATAVGTGTVLGRAHWARSPRTGLLCPIAARTAREAAKMPV